MNLCVTQTEAQKYFRMNKQMTKCPAGTVFNPATGKCVLVTGSVGKKLLASGGTTEMTCAPGKVPNPRSASCVKKAKEKKNVPKLSKTGTARAYPSNSENESSNEENVDNYWKEWYNRTYRNASRNKIEENLIAQAGRRLSKHYKTYLFFKDPRIAHRIKNIRNTKKTTLLMIAAKHGNLKMVTKLLSLGSDVNAVDEDGNTALSLFINKITEYSFGTPKKSNARTILQVLIDAGANVNLKGKYDNPPLLTVLYEKDRFMYLDETVKMLVDAGADVNAKGVNNEDWPALHHAVYMNMSFNIIKTLLRAGANVHATNKHGKTVLDIVKDPTFKRSASNREGGNVNKKKDLEALLRKYA